MKRKTIRIFCLLTGIALIFTGCVGNNVGGEAAGEEISQTEPTNQNTEPTAQDQQADTLQSALDQLVGQGGMTKAEKQALLTYMQEQTGDDPIRSAIEDGVITQQQAQALGQLLGVSGPQEGIQGAGASGDSEGAQISQDGQNGYWRYDR